MNNFIKCVTRFIILPSVVFVSVLASAQDKGGDRVNNGFVGSELEPKEMCTAGDKDCAKPGKDKAAKPIKPKKKSKPVEVTPETQELEVPAKK